MPHRDTQKIRELNDAFRRTFAGGSVVITPAVSALSDEDRAALIQLVRCYEDFTPGNDPHEEHDFGVIEFRGSRYLWKVDIFDQHYLYGSADPANPNLSGRTLTIMRADEY